MNWIYWIVQDYIDNIIIYIGGQYKNENYFLNECLYNQDIL